MRRKCPAHVPCRELPWEGQTLGRRLTWMRCEITHAKGNNIVEEKVASVVKRGGLGVLAL